MPECALRMTDIVKTYGGVPVLQDVNFSVAHGEIHALLGENGAGKTTLMNILGGVVPRDKGKIELFGKVVSIASPANAQAFGIAFIHQELNVVNDLKVYENMFLGKELTKRGRLDVKRMCQLTAEVFQRMNVNIDPRALMGGLETSYKQIVEIAKSLLWDAKIIIMDEPTTSLTQKEIENVFSIMRNLTREQGATIIFISHKLGEVVEFCDSYTVLRNGEKVAEGQIIEQDGEKISQTDIARMMVGRDVLNVDVFEPHEVGEEIFRVEHLSVEGAVDDVSFSVRRGEILGFTGLLGDGKEQLVRCLFGDMEKKSGTVTLEGKVLETKHPAQGKKQGIGFLPSNRKENAIIKDFSVTQNITIVTLDDLLVGTTISKKREDAAGIQARDQLRIKVQNLSDPITSLSGGNQQKAVLSKWLRAKPKIMIFSNPTQGVDVGAKNEIYAQIMELAKQGIGIIITSGEAQEIIKTCDRALVMYHGQLQGELSRGELSEANIMILSTGGMLDN